MRWPGGMTRAEGVCWATVAAAAIRASRSTQSRTSCDASAIKACRAGCSSACTRPRWRSGIAMAARLGRTPKTTSPASAIPSRISASCRGEATRLRITPATRTPGRNRAMPCATAAAVCACPLASITRTTGQPIRCAKSALAPLPVAPGAATPSNSPIDPSARTRSAPSATVNIPSSIPGGIAQVSRLNEKRPLAARWKAGSM